MTIDFYHQDVRTTVTLDDDVAAKSHAVARGSGRPFKQVVNETLRLGLRVEQTLKPKKRFVVRTRETGLRPGFQLDRVSALLNQVEEAVER